MFLLSIPSKSFFFSLGCMCVQRLVVDWAQLDNRQLWQNCGSDVLSGVVPDSVSVAGRRFRTKPTMIQHLR